MNATILAGAPLEACNTTAATQFVGTRLETYAYRRFGAGAGLPLLCLQHFTGTLDNWDPAVTDPLAREREVILFESAGLGRSTGEVPGTVAGMSAHLLAFTEALGLTQVDVLGFSLGGMVAQQIALERPALIRKMLLVGTAPEGGEEILSITVIGEQMRQVASRQDDLTEAPTSHQRQLAWFTRDGQQQIARLRVGVAGAGGTGSPLIQNLVYLGVRDFVIVDHDYADETSQTDS